MSWTPRASGDEEERARGATARCAERGFTVIELMLVVSILGVVAAGLTAGLVGVGWLVRERGANQERGQVQRAYDAMLAAQQVPPNRACEGAPGAGEPTDDMRVLGGTARPAPGGHAHHPVALYPTYVHHPTTRYHYYCAGHGTIRAADAP